MRPMELLQRLFYTALGAVSLFYFVVKISLSYWKKRGILHEKPKFFYGNLAGVGEKRHIATVLKGLYDKYASKAPFIGFYAFLKPMVLILDVNVAQHILVKDSEYFTDRGLYHNTADDPLSGNLLQLDGSEWKCLKRHLNPVFDGEALDLVYPTLQKVASNFESTFHKKFAGDDIININILVDGYNLDVVSALAFGLEGNSLQYYDTEFRAMTRSYLNNFNFLCTYLAYDFPNLARILQYKSFDQYATEYFSKIVNNKLMERAWLRGEQPQDFLKLFIDQTRQRHFEERLDVKKVAAQAFSFILIGLEAANTTLIFCLYELALQPEIQQKARLEINRVVPKKNKTITLENLRDMHYVKQIMYETLRKHSPYPFLLRNTMKDYEVPDTVFMLKKGNRVIIPVSAIHNDTRLYPSPEKFDPERFAGNKLENPPLFWLPFGAGLRKCNAQEFSEFQMLLGLVTLLRHFQFIPCTETSKPLEYDNSKIMLSPKTQLMLRVERV